MDCEALRERLAAHLDGETTAEEKRRLEEHLASCAACRREWEEIKSLTRLTRSEFQIKAPAGLRSAVLAAGREEIDAEKTRRTEHAAAGRIRLPRFALGKGWRWSWRVGAPALAAAAVILITLIIRWPGDGRDKGPGGPFTEPAAVVVLRYGDTVSPGGDVTTTRPELSGLDLGDM